MRALILAASVALAAPPTAAALLPVPIRVLAKLDLPLRAPAGWTVEEQDRATILTPSDVPEGRFYRVMVTLADTAEGRLDELLEDGKKMMAEIGTFTAKADPVRSTSEGGWGSKAVLGTVEGKERALLAYVVAIQKGTKGGVVVALADGVETMAAYADAFAKMIREMGGAEPAPAAAPSGAIRLEYRAPAAWVETKIEGLPYLVKEKHEEWVKYRISLLVLPGEALAGSVREQFQALWRAYVTPNYATALAPIPLMARLASGCALAFDADAQAKDRSGAEVTVALYAIAHGGRVVPVLCVCSGPDWTFDRTAEAEIGEFLGTARIPGATEQRVALFSAAALAGDWSEASSEFANYVTRGGDYAGDATISAGTFLDLRADGSYARTLVALTAGRSVREKDAGTWTLEDDELVLSKAGRYSLLGSGTDAKAGRFLVLGTYPNQKARLRLTNPRGILQALWMRAK